MGLVEAQTINCQVDMASILRRPLDLLIVVFFILFVLIAWTIGKAD